MSKNNPPPPSLYPVKEGNELKFQGKSNPLTTKQDLAGSKGLCVSRSTNKMTHTDSWCCFPLIEPAPCTPPCFL